ncbi:hypothetical protein [Streptomyces sp. MI02-7b]|uniref:hypothetical protein n=1 Tax=Streptomyces sp. MI02-7b TaxID=462941 RepID=UPI0029A8CF38|nr:hypothetical protein [Streptomyces sp. MI02-7b]MDX3075832.1 hypothetical protein [Streptomyces sp. MI02-7b]
MDETARPTMRCLGSAAPAARADVERQGRLTDLLAAALYEGGTFSAIVAVLHAFRVPPTTWLRACGTQAHGTALARVLDEYLAAADRHCGLRSTEDGEEEDAGTHEVLGTYRARMLGEALDDAADLAVRAALAALREVGASAATGGTSLVARLLRECAAFHRSALMHPSLPELSREATAPSAFDIELLLADAQTPHVAMPSS